MILVDEIDDLLRLLFDSLSRRHNQHNEVSNSSSSSPHVTKSLVPGGIDEGDLLIVADDVEGTDFLGDASDFSLCNVGTPQIVDKGSFSMVDVSHDGHHWRLRNHAIGISVGIFNFLHVNNFEEPDLLLADEVGERVA